MGKNNSKDLLLKAMRENQESKIRSILEKDTSIKDEYINGNKDHTALCMAAYFGSFVSSKVLLEVIVNL
jgi:hypothetical protein